MRGRSRSDEFSAVLGEVTDIAIDGRVDVVVLSGDIFEQRSPSPEAEGLVLSAFMRLFREGIQVVGIPGNHDSAAHFDAQRELLQQVGVRIVPHVFRPESGGVVEVRARSGSARAAVACIPFVPERRFGDAASLFEVGENWYLSYADGMSQLLNAMTTTFSVDTVNIVTAHVLMDGARLGGTEREVMLGPDFAVAPSRLPPNTTYVALGHVHCPQSVAGAPGVARYAGSLLQLDFGEEDDRKGVVLVEARPGHPPRVEEVPLSQGRRLATVTGSFDAVVERAKQLPSHYLRVRIATTGPVPGIADRLLAVVPNAVAVELLYEGRESITPEIVLSGLEPREQFLAYYRAEHEAEPDPRLLAAFDEILGQEQPAK
jgi:exonuclease SbcD